MIRFNITIYNQSYLHNYRVIHIKFRCGRYYLCIDLKRFYITGQFIHYSICSPFPMKKSKKKKKIMKFSWKNLLKYLNKYKQGIFVQGPSKYSPSTIAKHLFNSIKHVVKSNSIPKHEHLSKLIVKHTIQRNRQTYKKLRISASTSFKYALEFTIQLKYCVSVELRLLKTLT